MPRDIKARVPQTLKASAARQEGEIAPSSGREARADDAADATDADDRNRGPHAHGPSDATAPTPSRSLAPSTRRPRGRGLHPVMRLVLQRVTEASVTVDGETVGNIGRGLMVLCGISEDDDEAAAEWACRKLLGIRLWEADGKPWAHSVTQAKLGVLLVSQFTLHAQLKGNKPDFHRAMKPELSRPFWNKFVQRVTQAHKGLPVQTGVFGAKMDVSLVNDGPVTIELDSAAESSKAPAPAPAPSAAKAPQASPPAAVAPPIVNAAHMSADVRLAGTVGVLLRAAGAFTTLRVLEDRGIHVVALQSVRTADGLCVAVALRPPGGGAVAVARLFDMCGPGAVVIERWDRSKDRAAGHEALVADHCDGLFGPADVQNASDQ